MMMSNDDLPEPSMYLKRLSGKLSRFGPAAHVLGQWPVLQHVAKTFWVIQWPSLHRCIDGDDDNYFCHFYCHQLILNPPPSSVSISSA